MVKNKTEATGPSFEEALNELESIVKLMEEGNLSLDETLAKFEKGIALSRLCSRKLEQAEKKIDLLLCSENGEISFEPVNLPEERDE